MLLHKHAVCRRRQLAVSLREERLIQVVSTIITLPTDKLKRAIGIREQIDALSHELQQLLRGIPGSMAGGPSQPRKHNLSAEGRARIVQAQRQRWAKFNASRGTRPGPITRHNLSAEGRARVSAAVKARWARYRAEKALAGL